MQYAQSWAAARGLHLDDSLSMRDEGLSAFHQHHVKHGALGLFLRAIEAGRIAPGSVLIVEGLDRLSRAEPLLAQAQLAQIINAGITVVTASDSKEYNRATLKAQPMDLVYSLLVMIRAHEESDTKSKRIKASIRKLCERWQAGTYRGPIRNGKDPQWVSWDGSQFVLVPERVAALRTAFELFRGGYGSVSIMQNLKERGLALTNGTMHASHLYKIIRNPALTGRRVLEIDGEEFHLVGYYPAVLTQEEFDSLQIGADERTKRKGKGEIPGVVTGLGITYCGYCGTAMISQNLMAKRLPDGSMHPYHRRLICVGYSQNTGCPVGGSVSVVPVENAVMSYCADQLNLTSLTTGDDQRTPLQADLAKAKQGVAEIEKALARVTEALLADDSGATPLTFVRRARELEQELASKQVLTQKIERQLMAMTSNELPALAEAWAALVHGVEGLDADARMKARKLVADTFDRIVVYHRGLSPEQGEAGPIAVLLKSKAGQTRLLNIHRRTGFWQASDTMELPPQPFA
jgi:DNA invertase Pin-like site-specific DNA recombinase/SOS response regulatory protein OraA/RecX